MKSVVCPQCGANSKVGTKFCPQCGASLENAEVVDKGKSFPTKMIVIIALVVAILAASIVTSFVVISNLNPTGKYQTLISKGKTAEANELYNKKIASNEELVKKLADEENEKMLGIYEKYVSKSLSYDEATKKLDIYKQSDVSKATAAKYQGQLDSLKKSRDAYDAAIKAETEDDIETAISKYKLVVEEDENYEAAQAKTEELQTKWKSELLTEAENYASNKQYTEAINTINKIINKSGSDDELTELLEKYTALKSEQYVKVKCVNKTVTPENTSKWIFSNYVNFVFEVTNNSDKDIKGIEGVLTVNDLFGKEILSMGCDFTGHTIRVGEKYTESDLSFECNEFMDTHMKMYNTDYSDLEFIYEVSKIVYADGTTVVPE